MFWREHSYVAYSTTYVGYLTLHRKSAFWRRKKISCRFQLLLTSFSVSHPQELKDKSRISAFYPIFVHSTFTPLHSYIYFRFCIYPYHWHQHHCPPQHPLYFCAIMSSSSFIDMISHCLKRRAWCSYLTQKLGNNVRRDSQSIATKVCSKICHK